ncbi:hypothetical protein [Pseudonocardia alaniniphila]|uniref:RES domain-containing protein n=1 Tax=Pseudonocardia alaniniphila TaxID=75291 RepID=A0ABS9TRL1_9PSEU|nr:hypothetical protein [Pseudonocardia alaniniphila]MCH6170871.1 hypothetical protein [Pseudonocardia alaniniphila]
MTEQSRQWSPTEEPPMTDLLDLALAAHGGLDRWRRLTQLRVECSVGGTTWPSDGVLARSVATVDTRAQRTYFDPFGGPGHRALYTPGHVEIVDTDGAVLAQRNDPRRAFAGHEQAGSWDRLHKAYFAGYALWNYVSLPFLLAQNGFRAEEIEPWPENGQTWRRLRVEFPDHITTHAAVQTFYFGSGDHLLRRHDYDAEVLGGQPTAHYSVDYRNFAGITFPTRRWVVPRNPDNTTPDGPVLVSLDIQAITPS